MIIVVGFFIAAVFFLFCLILLKAAKDADRKIEELHNLESLRKEDKTDGD